MPAAPVSAVILAGGQSSRMGRDKALLPFGGFDTLAEYQFRRLQPLFDEVFVSLKTDKLPFQAPIIYDCAELSAPIVALTAILRAVKTPRVFVLAVDTPFFDAAAIARLLAVDAPVAMARTSSGEHPMCAVYDRALLPLFEAALGRNELALHRALANEKIVYADFEERLLTNLNHPNEYEAAKCESA